ncbi:hypothetical protein IWQ55_000017 [Labrenzia sp. EL_208]|nr:hypothetical protein [Labrenzia sp. EL_132]MBG6226825.1 hypothetical protein [Labrenzia sp. EL_208]
MIMNNILTKFAAAAVLTLFATGASAATISAVQGTEADGSPVSAARSILANASDGDVNTFYSLGIGGSITASVSPLDVAGASAVEVTFNNSAGFPEAAKVYAGTDSSGQLLGEIFNLASGVSTTFTGLLGSSIVASGNTPSTGFTSFLINIGLVETSALTLVDTTIQFGPTGSKDGFDVGEFSVTPVPLPAAGWMLLVGVGGLAAMRRRQRV